MPVFNIVVKNVFYVFVIFFIKKSFYVFILYMFFLNFKNIYNILTWPNNHRIMLIYELIFIR